jgi:large subunit ribosomal protein L25
MATTPKLKAKKRSVTGRKVKQLRREALLPANVYGKDVKSLAIELPLKEFEPVFKAAGETNIIDLSIDKETKPRPVLIGNVQLDPVTDAFLHVDFRQVDLTKKVVVAVPLELVGEAPAVAKGGVLVKLVNELEIEALPKDLPDKFEVDISGLEEIGNAISLKQVPIDSGKVKLMTENLDELVVKIEAPAKEEEPVPPTPVGVEAEAEAEAGAEGEKPAEAGKAPAAAKAPAGEEEKKPAPDQDKKPAANKS